MQEKPSMETSLEQFADGQRQNSPLMCRQRVGAMSSQRGHHRLENGSPTSNLEQGGELEEPIESKAGAFVTGSEKDISLMPASDTRT